MPYISQNISIKEGKVFRNGSLYLDGDTIDFKGFAKKLYQHLGIDYPKFYKMDNLCKLAFLASEIILEDNEEQDVALIFCNKEGSLDTDIQHQQNIQDAEDFYPSPAVFVYTLPNICLGEVCIRHQLNTENAFLLAENYQTTYIMPYSEFLLTSRKAKKVLCGWLRMLEGEYQANFYLVEEVGYLSHNKENIEYIINK